MPLSLTVRSAIGAAATIANVLSGLAIEYQGSAVVLTVYGNGDIAGMTQSLFGHRGDASDLYIPPASGLGVASTVGKVKVNEDFIGQFPLPAGTRLVHSVTNPGAASNITIQYNVGT